jgi:outer membrane protein OmpA-like peptidoglycan-associated protein/tetratricopeptide (TPR) repeat protein
MKITAKIVLILSLLMTSVSYGQVTRNYAKEADNLWVSGMYEEAADAYKKASEKMSVKNDKARLKKAKFAFLSGECYRLIHNFPAAEQQYEKAILLKYQETEPKTYYYLGEMQMAQCKHKKALGNYKKYNELNPGDPLTAVRIESCKKYDEFQTNKTRHEMTEMSKLNTTSYDYGAVVNSRGTEMYFTSSREASTGENTDLITGEEFTDIFVTTIDRKNNFSEPVPLDANINTIDNEGAMCFDSRGKTMWFTRCVNQEKMNLGCDIYMVEKKSKGFGEPVKLNLKDHDSTHVGHPAVTKDGKTLIFASNMAGGEGGVDLWMSTFDRRADSWSLPVNLGPEVNTPGNEVFPTISEDGSLYYSSNGMVGLGGLDLFKATQIGEEIKWEKPTNLGAPLNTCADDYHIIFTKDDAQGQQGFMSSNRAGSKGPRENPSQDIYSFLLPPVLVDVMVTIVDQETGDPVPNMEVRVVGSDGSNYIVKSDADGMVTMTEKEDGSRYVMPGYSFSIDVPSVEGEWLGNKDKFSTETVKQNTRIIREISVLNIKKPIRLPEVRYDLGKWDLQVIPDSVNSKDSLNYLYQIMVDNPNLVVELMAHTDSRGSASANRTLSQKRAQSCVDYLVNEKGLPAERFVPKGYGEDTPNTYYEINPETGDTTTTQKLTETYINTYKKSDKDRFEMLHQKNRRTECRIISFDYVPTEAPKPEETEEEGGE